MNDYEYVVEQIKENMKEEKKLKQEALDLVDYDKLYNSIIKELSKMSMLEEKVMIFSPCVGLYRFEDINEASSNHVKEHTKVALEMLEEKGIPEIVSTDVYLLEKVFYTVRKRLNNEGFEANVRPIDSKGNISISVSLKKENESSAQTSKIAKTETLLDKIKKFFFRKK